MAGRRPELSDDPGRLARDAYTHLHLPIVAAAPAIIAIIVADLASRLRRRGRGEPSPLEALEASARPPAAGWRPPGPLHSPTRATHLPHSRGVTRPGALRGP